LRQGYVPPPSALSGRKPQEEDGCSLEEISQVYGDLSDGYNHSTTLHDSATAPGILSYVLLFHRANPRWDLDRIIFAKSHLDILPTNKIDGTDGESVTVPSEQADDDSNKTEPPQSEPLDTTAHKTENPVSSPPIAVFKQTSSRKQRRNWSFDGWYKITKLVFLEPDSPELVRMLEQKFTQTTARGNVKEFDRSAEKWQKSLRTRWAVIKLEKDEQANRERSPPDIPRLDPSPEESKGVNELLRDMRLESEGGDGAESGANKENKKVDEASGIKEATSNKPAAPA
jgi:hypothetical protein